MPYEVTVCQIILMMETYQNDQIEQYFRCYMWQYWCIEFSKQK